MRPVPDSVVVDDNVILRAIPGIPLVEAGDDLPSLIVDAVDHCGVELRTGDILVVASKLVSRAEGRFVNLATVEAGDRAREVAARVGKDPRLVECILQDASEVSRASEGVLVVRHRLGFISANAAIDGSNARPADGRGGEWILRMPQCPDESARRIRHRLEDRYGVSAGVIISDSHGRPFRLGTVGVAVGVAGVPALSDRRGSSDLFDRPLEHTITALADQVAAAADLVAGQGAQARGVVLVRGVRWPESVTSASDLLRPADRDLYA